MGPRRSLLFGIFSLSLRYKANHRKEQDDETKPEIEEGIFVEPYPPCRGEAEDLDVGNVAPVKSKAIIDEQRQLEASDEHRYCGKTQE
jgi:hypothetical protein